MTKNPPACGGFFASGFRPEPVFPAIAAGWGAYNPAGVGTGVLGMGFVRAAVFVSIVAIGGAAYVYRDDVTGRSGLISGWERPPKPPRPRDSGGPARSRRAVGAAESGRRRAGRGHAGHARAMPVAVDAVGTVQSIASVQIKPRMDSQIMKVNVEEGALVKEGISSSNSMRGP